MLPHRHRHRHPYPRLPHLPHLRTAPA